MKARELEETKARGSIASSGTQVIPLVEVPEVNFDAFIDADTGHGGPWLAEDGLAAMRERATEFENRAAIALFETPKRRHNHPVHKTKQLGIAGLFSDKK